MRIVPLASAPAQAFTLTIDGVRWGVAIKEARGVMCADISRNSEILLSGMRVLAGEVVIPYRYLQTANFLFLTAQNELPNWRQFGVSQLLVYLSAGETAATPQITVGEILAAQRRIGYLTTDDGFYITTDGGELLTDD